MPRGPRQLCRSESWRCCGSPPRSVYTYMCIYICICIYIYIYIYVVVVVVVVYKQPCDTFVSAWRRTARSVAPGTTTPTTITIITTTTCNISTNTMYNTRHQVEHGLLARAMWDVGDEDGERIVTIHHWAMVHGHDPITCILSPMGSGMCKFSGWERGTWSAGWNTQQDGSEAHGQQDGAVRNGHRIQYWQYVGRGESIKLISQYSPSI
jgi:hypothetical protein